MVSKLIVGCLFAVLSIGVANAQSADFKLDPQSAEQIIAGCKAYSKTKGQSHAIAIHDKGGFLVAALRMPGNNAGTMEFAQAKAKAVGIWRFSTARMERSTVDFAGFAAAPHVVTVPGGVPIFTSDGKTFLGSVGVSGEAPADDVACAVAGIESAGLTAQRIRN
ncbi:MAG: heme-binding protein [Parasphingorhabdus sp.]